MCTLPRRLCVPERSRWTTARRSLSPSARPQMLGKLSSNRGALGNGQETPLIPCLSLCCVTQLWNDGIMVHGTAHFKCLPAYFIRYSLHNPHRAIVPLFFARVHCFNSAPSITEARFAYSSVPSGFASNQESQTHAHFFCLALCVCQSSSPPFCLLPSSG